MIDIRVYQTRCSQCFHDPTRRRFRPIMMRRYKFHPVMSLAISFITKIIPCRRRHRRPRHHHILFVFIAVNAFNPNSGNFRRNLREEYWYSSANIARVEMITVFIQNETLFRSRNLMVGHRHNQLFYAKWMLWRNILRILRVVAIVWRFY